MGIIRAGGGSGLGFAIAVIGGILGFIVCPILYGGLKILKPTEALMLTLFGKYYGALEGVWLYYVNPFVGAINPTKLSAVEAAQKQKVKTGGAEKSI